MSSSARPRHGHSHDPAKANNRKGPAPTRAKVSSDRDRAPPSEPKPASVSRSGSWKKLAAQSARRALGLLGGMVLFVLTGRC